MLIQLFIFLVSISALNITTQNPDQTIWFPKYMQYAAVAYCPDLYKTQTFQCKNNCGGDAADTIMVKAVSNQWSQGAAYVAVHNQTKSILVVFRGTTNLMNQLENLAVVRVPTHWTNLEGKDVKVLATN